MKFHPSHELQVLTLVAPLKPRTSALRVGVLVALVAIAACDWMARPPGLIHRRALFGEPARYQIRLSPDGRLVSFLAPIDGAMNIWIAPRDKLSAARPVTHESGKTVAKHQWAADGHTIVFEEMQLGTETVHVSTIDVRGGAVRDLTPYAGVRARFMTWSLEHPDEILISLNARNPSWPDIYRVTLSTGAVKLDEINPGFGDIVADNDLRVRYGIAPTRDGGLDIYERAASGWKVAQKIGAEDAPNFRILDFDHSNEKLYMIDARGRDHSVLTRWTPATGAAEILAADPDLDISVALFNPLTSTVEAFATDGDRMAWHVIEPSIAEDFKTLTKAAGAQGSFVVLNRTHDDASWVVHIDRPVEAGVYHLYDRAKKALTPLPTRPALAGAPLREMYAARIKARDGLPLLLYYTLAPEQDPRSRGKPTRTAPLVLAVHSGPWARDEYGFNTWHQWLANRGYAVLSVNFRGSTGFGKAFLNAADGEWGGAMQRDLEDGVNWAVAQGIADKRRIAIFGSNYGGYAALAGLAFSQTYACGVSYGGPSDLAAMIERMPAAWTSMRDMVIKHVGDPSTPQGRARLEAASPLTRARDITRPLLIAQGLNDPTVDEKQTQEIVETLKDKGVPVTYVRYPDETGSLSHEANMLSFYAVAEGFLGHCLGGRAEPIAADLKGSSLEIVEGAAYVPGLIDAMAQINTPAH
jgi:dipeptidyl aminopeptidase/acylaminoacyl peptidase